MILKELHVETHRQYISTTIGSEYHYIVTSTVGTLTPRVGDKLVADQVQQYIVKAAWRVVVR